MSCLNTSTTASAYECKIAILLAKTATVAKKNFMCYVFKISTLDLLGAITGGMTSTPGLAAADSMVDSNIPSVSIFNML